MSQTLPHKHYYAHTSNLSDGTTNPDKTTWEPLFTPFGKGENQCQERECGKCKNLEPNHGHLNKVAFMAGKLAFGMTPKNAENEILHQWGYLAGIWHDLGKFSEEFQSYLVKASDIHNDEVLDKIDHTSAGAKLASKSPPILGHLVANAIAGHHAGLLNSIAQNHPNEASLENRLQKEYGKELPRIELPNEISNLGLPSHKLERDFFYLSLFQRMLFSCLVDADFLCTEAFMSPELASMRPENHELPFQKAFQLLHQEVSSFQQSDHPVSLARQAVYQDCLVASQIQSNHFSLTVPTGGGKTLSSMAFALKHAIKHKKRRIIYVIPFTSIIEQNAQVYRDVFKSLGGNFIIEHHSSITPSEEKENTTNRLSTENWEAPIIITTAVQFFESFFAHRTSRARKIHNVANSVVIFDEAQCLPLKYLHPCLALLENLAKHFSVTNVLCTATQPAVKHSSYLPFGLKGVQEIIQDVPSLFSLLKRTQLQFIGDVKDNELISRIAEHDQALVIVNTKGHAQLLAEELEKHREHVFHLSTSMCPQHRKDVLGSVKKSLIDHTPIKLVSTQLIEAGVDIDFPVVFRSLAGLDSISQAAGRCNRNGNSPIASVYVFRSEHQNESYFATAKGIGYETLDLHKEAPLDPEAINAYFDKYYCQNKQNWDAENILNDFKKGNDQNLPFLFQYKSASQKFKLIKEDTIPVIIPYDAEAGKLIETLRKPSVPLHRSLFRKLQSYTVQVRHKAFQEHISEFESLRDGEFYALTNLQQNYNQTYGLLIKPLTISDCIL